MLSPTTRLLRRFCRSTSQQDSDVYDRLFSAVERGSLVVRVPDFGGAFELDIRSDILKCLLIHRTYEPKVVEVVRERVDPQNDVIDVGANVGLFTILMAGLISQERRLLAIEPTPGAVEYLRKNIRENGLAGKVIVFEGLATNRCQPCTLNVIPGMEEYSSIGGLIHPATKGQRSHRITVPGETIDRLVDRFALRPGFIKIDTEGAEYQVLSGDSKHPEIQTDHPLRTG